MDSELFLSQQSYIMNEEAISINNGTITIPNGTWRPPTSDSQMRGASMFVAIVTLSVFAASICVLIYYSIKRLHPSQQNDNSENGNTIFGVMNNGSHQRSSSQDKPPSYEDILEACKAYDESLPTYEDAQRHLQELSVQTLSSEPEQATTSADNTQTVQSSPDQRNNSTTSEESVTSETRIRISSDNADDAISVASCAETNYTTLHDREASSSTIANYFNNAIEMEAI